MRQGLAAAVGKRRLSRCHARWRIGGGFGIFRDFVEDYGGGSASGRPVRAVQIGGPFGAYLPESRFDTVIDYEARAGIGALLGHGGGGGVR